MKQEVIGTIFDTMPKEPHLNELGQEARRRDDTAFIPYFLGWLYDDVEIKIDQQCKIRFTITKEFIDKVTCEVVSLDIFQVILGNPYFIGMRCLLLLTPKVSLQKDGRKFLVTQDLISSIEDLTFIGQAKRMVMAC